MIQPRTMLNVADNSGAKILQCFHVLGGSKRRYAQLGDAIVGTVKEAEPRRLVKKHDVVRAVIVRQKKDIAGQTVLISGLMTTLAWFWKEKQKNPKEEGLRVRWRER